MTNDDDALTLPLPDDCPYTLTRVALGTVPDGGVWVDAVLTHTGEPVARVIQRGDGGADLLRPLGPGGWAAVDAYREYAAMWGLPHGITWEPADAMTAELLLRWAEAEGRQARQPQPGP
ncbi:MAG: hypothetical protein NVV66_18605 [Cellulomonas sp.]|uniref:hypothetical protein n=1 Tax=Cellulomonas sp. TaxID=40001 RepID=UPI00258E7919|nr:hypothetical protein [Cellulomonas sp.]MCR6706607.1 hypothetical protein [Cellulomonas sp.]